MGTIRAMSSREKDSADFDLEAFIDLFDEALASDDPSVQKTLQHLMIIAALARNHAKHDRQNGPLRRMYDDLHNLNRRIDRLETERSRLQPGFGPIPGGGSPIGPYVPTVLPGTTTWPPRTVYSPGTIWSQSGTSDPVAPAPIAGLNSSLATSAVAERIEDLLKSNYKGSSVGTDNVKIT